MPCHIVCTTGPTGHHTLVIKGANPAKSGAQIVVHHEYGLWGLTTDRLALSCDSGYKLGPRRETDVETGLVVSRAREERFFGTWVL